MAKRKSGRYRMTPKRRAALKKAQMISAKKRRRKAIGNGLRTAGIIGASIGATFVTYHGNQYIKHPSRIVTHGKIAKNATSSFVAGNVRRFRGGGDLKPPTPNPQKWARQSGGAYLFNG